MAESGTEKERVKTTGDKDERIYRREWNEYLSNGEEKKGREK